MSMSMSQRAVVAITPPLYGAGHDKPILRVFSVATFHGCNRMQHVSHGR
jgi:hypothetical protein